MRLVAVAYVLLAILLFSLEFPFFTAMEAAYPDRVGAAHRRWRCSTAAVTVAAFLVGTLLANRLYARLGVATVALALPLVYLAGFGALDRALHGRDAPSLVRFGQQVTQRGVTNAAFGAFFSVLPARRRGQVLAFMDGVPGQLGTMLSGVLLIVAASLALEQLFLIGHRHGRLCLGVGLLIRRAYASSLVQTLREGRAEQVLEGGPGLAALGRDARVIAELRAATAAERSPGAAAGCRPPGPHRRPDAEPDLQATLRRRRSRGPPRGAAGGRGRSRVARPADVLMAALGDADGRVRSTALAALGELGLAEAVLDAVATGTARSTAWPGREPARASRARRPGHALGPTRRLAQAIIDAMLASGVRRRPRGRPGAPSRGSAGRWTPAWSAGLLADPSPRVRAAALRAGAALASPDDGLDPFLAAFDDESREVRLTAAAIVRGRADAPPLVLDRLRLGTDRRAGSGTLGTRGPRPKPSATTSSSGRTARCGERRSCAAGRRAGGRRRVRHPRPTSRYVVGRREAAIEARLLQALAILGAPEASGLIRRCLHAPDPEVRAQAIEAIDALGEPRLARGVVRLLEREPPMRARRLATS